MGPRLLRRLERAFLDDSVRGMAFLTQAMNPMMAVSFTLGQSCSATRLKQGGIACLNIGRSAVRHD